MAPMRDNTHTKAPLRDNMHTKAPMRDKMHTNAQIRDNTYTKGTNDHQPTISTYLFWEDLYVGTCSVYPARAHCMMFMTRCCEKTFLHGNCCGEATSSFHKESVQLDFAINTFKSSDVVGKMGDYVPNNNS